MASRGAPTSILFLLVAASSSSPVFGNEPVSEATMAEALFREGRDASVRGDHATARTKFEASFRLEPAAGTVLNLSLEEEQLGDLAASWMHAHRALEMLPSSDVRHSIAAKLYKRVDERVPRLRLVTTSPLADEVQVMRDGVSVAPAAWNAELPVNPGRHVVLIRAKGRRDRTIDVLVSERARLIVPLVVGDLEPAPASNEVPPKQVHRPFVQSADDRAKPLRLWAWVSAGVAGAGLATSVTFGGLALGKKGVTNVECDASGCSDVGAAAARDGRAFATVATVAGVATAAFATTSVVLFLVSRPTKPVVVAPMADATTKGVMVAVPF